MRNLKRTPSVNSKFIYSLCTVLFLLTYSLSAKAQSGSGDSMGNPYIGPTLSLGSNVQQGQCTSCYPLYNGHTASPGNDKWIKITVTSSGYLKLIGGTSTFDSVFYLYDGTGTLLTSDDDSTGSGDNVGHGSLQPLINYPVTAGTYYLVVDGSSKYIYSPGTSWTSASGSVNVYFQLN